MTYAAYMLRSGRRYDPEDYRATERLHLAYQILETLGAAPTIVHGNRTYFDWASAGSLNPDKHLCSLNGSGYGDCTITYPEWVNDAMLERVWDLADTFRTARGQYNRNAALAAR